MPRPRIRIYPYKQGSRSAASLAAALGGRVLKLEGSTFRPRPGDLIVNWGASATPFAVGRDNLNLLNVPMCTQVAADKLRSFRSLRDGGVRVPDFWTSTAEIPPDAFPIVCRTVLNGHSGRGIVLADTAADLVPAPLYVRYVPKRDEYRVHVLRGRVIAVQRKARRTDVEDPNWRIRNHANGFNFVRDGVVAPDDVIAQSIMAVAALGLDFGAVDCGFNERHGQATVYEVNTAPGLEGTTITDYASAFRELIDRG